MRAGLMSGLENFGTFELHPDTEKHILLFDIIYCCNTYDLFNIIPFVKPNAKEKTVNY